MVNKIVSGYERFGQALDGHVCGSPQLVSRHQHAASSLLDVISDRQPKTVASADENSTTFLDLPREILSLVLRRLPDDRSLLETAK
ncbi:hypothetical protein TELCIR_22926, partial [Teladorsagia circumcincta]